MNGAELSVAQVAQPSDKDFSWQIGESAPQIKALIFVPFRAYINKIAQS